MKGLESYPHSWEILSLDALSDSKIWSHAPSALNIIPAHGIFAIFLQPAYEKQSISATLVPKNSAGAFNRFPTFNYWFKFF